MTFFLHAVHEWRHQRESVFYQSEGGGGGGEHSGCSGTYYFQYEYVERRISLIGNNARISLILSMKKTNAMTFTIYPSNGLYLFYTSNQSESVLECFSVL